MGNVSGMKFEAVYRRLNPAGRKVYFAGLRRLKVVRWGHVRGFRTASAALEYAKKWGERAERMIGKVSEASEEPKVPEEPMVIGVSPLMRVLPTLEVITRLDHILEVNLRKGNNG